MQGLIHLLERYKFTITENTPIDEEIALDPELLGKVFENLLASYNPETGTTARKQTGSFYTPREIVNYMVDESLKAYLQQKVTQTFRSANVKNNEAKAPQTRMSVPPSPQVTKTKRNLPHWQRAGSIYWINFRLADSLPQSKLRAWKEERDAWEQLHPRPWSDFEWNEYDKRFGERLEKWLDAGMGSCALARQDIREAVKSCLLKFDGERLHVHAAVIMPTHVHALIEPFEGEDLAQLMKGIKGASARLANRLLGTTGTFWLDESYDHIVRSQAQYEHFRRYIADNPVKAKLKDHEYWLFKGKGSTDIPVCATLFTERLEQLFAYTDEHPLFSDAEANALIDAIDSCKILDPACGSGAFPMGILHKLVFILAKLDPDNARWKQKQIDKAEQILDATSRETAIAAIEKDFETNNLDYGRKLYLIENCIYGVDIQPVAIQISKLRFFISLICDQRTNRNKAQNCGVRPLPNLETKFVPANTLIALDKGKDSKGNTLLFDQRLPDLESKLKNVRHKHFAAQRRQDKLRLQEKDAELREQIAAVLKDDGMSSNASRQLAAWNPYDQNLSANFFDPEWMFGVREGFDVIIGNPPYIRVDDIEKMYKILFQENFLSSTGKYDVYYLFFEKGLFLTANVGILSYITPNKYCAAISAEALRGHISSAISRGEIVSTSRLKVFEDAANYPIISVLVKGVQSGTLIAREALSIDKLNASSNNIFYLRPKEMATLPCLPINVNAAEMSLVLRLRKSCKTLAAYLNISEGLRIPRKYENENADDYMIVKQYQFARWTPIQEGAYVAEENLRKVARPTSGRYQNIMKKKIVLAEDALMITATLDDNKAVPQGGVYFGTATTSDGDLHYILGLLNSRLMSAVYEVMFAGMHMGGGYLRYRTRFLQELMVPVEENASVKAIASNVRHILKAKKTDPAADVSELEAEIDRLVYDLYGLTEDEIAIVEERAGDMQATKGKK